MTKRVVIVGAGVIGLSAALYCRRRGFEVTVVDLRPAARDGCSFGNAGIVVPSHFVPLAAPGMVRLGLKWMWNSQSPFYVKPRMSWDLLSWAARFWRACSRQHVERAAPLLRDLHLASRACYEELVADSLGDFGFSRRGLFLLCKIQRTLDEEAHTAEVARRLGMPAEVLDSAAIAEREPRIRADVCGGVSYPLDCHVSPSRLMAALQSHLEQEGCQFAWTTKVTGFRHTDRRVQCVETSLGELPADEVVLAGGVWSQEIARTIGLKLPIQAGKGYSLTLAQPRQRPIAPSILVEARIAVTPMGESLRFGGTMELAGLDESITATRVAGIIAAVPRYYPEFRPEDFAAVEPWCGLRPCSPDGLPYLGRTRRYDNLIIATGHAMMGVSLGPITGRIVAELISGNQPVFDLALLSPDRFG